MEKRFMKNKFRKVALPVLACAGLAVVLGANYMSTESLESVRRVHDFKGVEEKTVLLNNEGMLIPLRGLHQIRVASVNMGSAHASTFDSLLNKYTTIDSYTSTGYKGDSLNYNDLLDDLKFKSTVIVQVTDRSLENPETLRFLADCEVNKQLIVVLFGHARSLPNLGKLKAPVILTDDSESGANFSAQLIFGGVAARGTLSSTVSESYSKGDGYTTQKTRLKYTVPEEVGINSSDLREIDAVALEAIRERATPSAVVMVVKDGSVIYNKAFGSHTYDPSSLPTRITDIYDLASVTKISATTMAVMRLLEQQKLRLDTNVGAYIPKARNTDKISIPVRDVMLHQAGFIPFIPFYNHIKPDDFSRDSSYAYPVKAADNYYLRRNYFQEVMWKQMLEAPVKSPGKYVYSDLSMYYMKEMVERQAQKPLDQYVLDEFYRPLGMKTAGFNPRNRFSKESIVPTENDTYFRKTLLHGYVHDQGAAMVGGISGHAGLFSSANDLAILYQMILNGGNYGGEQFFEPGTVSMFTAKQSEISRRGLGFDRWDPTSTSGYPSKLASPQTFGHTGYTGTCVWVDPKYKLVYIFLSNRVHPTVSNKLSELSIRGRIQDVVYKAIEKESVAQGSLSRDGRK
jgi:serine-type D-Ala-D-Ala carboxypeptidase